MCKCMKLPVHRQLIYIVDFQYVKDLLEQVRGEWEL